MTVYDTEKVLSALPGKKKLKTHLHRFLALMRSYRDIVSSGSLAKPAVVAKVMAEVNGVKEEKNGLRPGVNSYRSDHILLDYG